MLILHGSDFQTGRPYRPRVAEAFLDLSRELGPDVVVVSGDLTQRAKTSEYRTVRALLDRVSVPVVVTPGNHDVPLYRVWERLLTPYRNWHRWIAPEVDSVTRIPGATLVALNSSAPRRAIVGGRLSLGQLAFARETFEGVGSDEARIVVTHHHFVPTPAGTGGSPLPHAAELLSAFEDMGVDLILGGHVHQTHMYTSRELVPDAEGAPGIPVLACGTTASSRGRAPEEGRNGLHVVRMDDDGIEVTPHHFDADEARWVPAAPRTFPRWRFARGAEAGEERR